MKLTTTNNVVARTLIFISIASATSCTSDVAIPWPETPTGSTGGSTSPGGIDDSCNGDPTCLAIRAQADCMALNTINEEQIACSLVKVRRGAGSLDCSSSEMCMLYTDNTLLCIDSTTGEYRDESGGSGNALSGVYTAVDGSVESVTTSVDPTESGSSASPNSVTASAAVSDVSVTGTSSMATTAVASAASTGVRASSQVSVAAQQTNGASAGRMVQGRLVAVAMPFLVAVL